LSRLKGLLDRVAEKRTQRFERSSIGGRPADNWTLDEDVNICEFNDIVRSSKIRISRKIAKQVTPQQTDVALGAFEQEIEDSRFILKIVDDDDPAVLLYTEETWRRAADFVRRLALHAHAQDFDQIVPPKIRPASDGSIDLFWQKGDRTLLVNFSPISIDFADYFGQSDGSEIAGRFKYYDDTPEIICWLGRL